MRLRPWSIALVVGAVALAAACNPRYRTFASYTPPASEAGRQCVAQCLSARQLCRGHKDVEIEQCRSEAYREAQIENLLRQGAYQLELERRAAGQVEEVPERPRSVQPGYRRCDQRASGLEAQCTGDFDLCYQNCGGEVAYTTHCVANCD